MMQLRMLCSLALLAAAPSVLAAAAAPDAIVECIDGQGNTYYQQDACKSGDQPASSVRTNASGTPIAPRAPQVPRAPRAPTGQAGQAGQPTPTPKPH